MVYINIIPIVQTTYNRVMYEDAYCQTIGYLPRLQHTHGKFQTKTSDMDMNLLPKDLSEIRSGFRSRNIN